MAVAGTKEIISTALDQTVEEGFERQASILEPVFASEDAKEGATAFAEKRPPVWKGR
ncbi:enoyl-CoA hydratase-related protein [Nocardioides sp.]|uniref:enoyl-CoA hydratase-related protein n=1 Tax=Nocardioides sp. TaxID=35761 RepID=UPI0027372ED1|nr:enoyl-CoA hydratase-related protein [Nocardioides sp.]MDP3894400.1 enoyl-CoA hydratase-related protein [Nocardioides sp.]